MYGCISHLALQSRKGTAMRLLILASLVFLFLQACMQEDLSKPTANALSGPPASPALALQQTTPVDTNLMRQVADDRTAGQIRPRVYLLKDSATGTEYQMNTGWRIMPRQSKSGAAKQALAKTTSLLQTWTDWSGQVETRIYECVTPSQAQHQSLGCQVEPGFILTGGGAYVDYGSGAGALLWESRPLDENLITWVASSKDHLVSNPHTLHVYAIGMRLKDNNGAYIPAGNLRGSIFKLRSFTTSPAEHYPNAFFSGDYSFGGGARTNWSCCGSLLTQLQFVEDGGGGGSNSFVVGAKDHGASELTTITIYEIYAKFHWCCFPTIDIPNFGSLTMKWPKLQGNPVNTGVAVALRDADPDWVITGPGGFASWTTGTGRLLFGIKPTGTYQGQISVYSKDHRATSAGFNTVTFAEVEKYRI
jgi:hypothetical protein